MKTIRASVAIYDVCASRFDTLACKRLAALDLQAKLLRQPCNTWR